MNRRARRHQRRQSPPPIRGRASDDARIVVIATVDGITHLMAMTADTSHGETVSAQLQELDPGVWADAGRGISTGTSRSGTTRLVAETSGETQTAALPGQLADDLRAVLAYVDDVETQGITSEEPDEQARARLHVLLDALEAR